MLPAGPRRRPLPRRRLGERYWVLVSAHALEAVPGRMPAALPVCPRRFAAGLKAAAAAGAPGAALLPHHVVAARAAPALPARGSAGGQHHRRSCTSRGRPSPPRLFEGGGGERSRVCAAGPLSRAPAGLPPPPSTAARRAVLVLASARALKACSTACPLHYLYARGGSQSWQSPSQFSQFCQSPSQPSHAVCLRLPWSKWMGGG
ncbi:hypothetical protein EMIHUDRAFT_432338 [Emiliania huxleyi CCMP1516]|uniref:Uncharacterized protein n=2 Tax=Emiliania huxleyi TaxID=2903 RepID=A0A0D3J411_EMIH1|nr:hypothetical protein EMIHUDRAFT_432338 [Emiliania huxleyi CCMP1516]EOD18246.1 hypothetical protein EMIHUDRAFT_432338 [Emiliania huxleyi CCMP1516]|eukprot:XP_005770675.1 hypothetical protein EMIHUDRAFT_432338 [Emiliania huxleyi CCMP1516]